MISDLIGSDPIHGWYQIQSDQIRYMDNIGSVILADVTALASGVGTRGGRRQKKASATPASSDAGGRRRALPSAPPSPDRAGVAARSRPRRRGGETRGRPANAPTDAGVRRHGGRKRTLPSTRPALDDAGGEALVNAGRSRRARAFDCDDGEWSLCFAAYLPR